MSASGSPDLLNAYHMMWTMTPMPDTSHPCPQHSAWLVRWFQTGALDPANRVAAFQSLGEPQTFTWSGSLILFSLGSRCSALATPVSRG